ncbi:unnamed protein product [Bursaphelenchus xylophilus]|nr:unnamed protein product [Bursaphelenchus xylophilus]CAG9117308.1 unnamed protein product [Bursaphelenchus xylophilus]
MQPTLQLRSLLTFGFCFWCVNAAPRIDVTERNRPHTTVRLDEPVWVEIKLPSWETDVFLMFNSSMDESVPGFDVYGTVCKQERNVLLFPRIKGPISKMISRTDLHSLKSRTKCNSTSTQSNETLIQLLIQPANLSSAEATINALILKNNTATTTKAPNTPAGSTTVSAGNSQSSFSTGSSSSGQSYNASQSTLNAAQTTTAVKATAKQSPATTTAVKTSKRANRKKREVPQSPPTAQTAASSLELDVILNDDDDYINLKIFEGTELGDKCHGMLRITSTDCISEPKKLESSNVVVKLDDVLKCHQKPSKLHIKVEPLDCAGSSNNYRLDVTPGNSTTGNLLYLWVPLALLTTCVIIVITLFIVYQRIRSKQRHEFQRQSVLSRTLSDPKPARIVPPVWEP